jgi:catechol 2,3-dioxygenase-like lactoylglutathione lyase family enzyme
MYDHVTLRVGDFAASLAFYKAVLAPLGIELRVEDGESAAFGESPSFLLTSGQAATANVHVAFSASDTGVVDAFHAAALQNGGKDNGAPGVRSRLCTELLRRLRIRSRRQHRPGELPPSR